MNGVLGSEPMSLDSEARSLGMPAHEHRTKRRRNQKPERSKEKPRRSVEFKEGSEPSKPAELLGAPAGEALGSATRVSGGQTSTRRAGRLDKGQMRRNDGSKNLFQGAGLWSKDQRSQTPSTWNVAIRPK